MAWHSRELDSSLGHGGAQSQFIHACAQPRRRPQSRCPFPRCLAGESMLGTGVRCCWTSHVVPFVGGKGYHWHVCVRAGRVRVGRAYGSRCAATDAQFSCKQEQPGPVRSLVRGSLGDGQPMECLRGAAHPPVRVYNRVWPRVQGLMLSHPQQKRTQHVVELRCPCLVLWRPLGPFSAH